MSDKNSKNIPLPKGQKIIREGVVKKGGINKRPTTPPPPLPPKGQGKKG